MMFAFATILCSLSWIVLAEPAYQEASSKPVDEVRFFNISWPTIISLAAFFLAMSGTRFWYGRAEVGYMILCAIPVMMVIKWLLGKNASPVAGISLLICMPLFAVAYVKA